MSYAVVHMQKYTRGSLRGIQSHIQRERESRNNPDIDYSRTAENYDLHNKHSIYFTQRVNEIVNEGRADPSRAVRKDAVLMCNFIVSSDKAFFNELPDLKRNQFFEDSYRWFAERYGKQNIVCAAVHMDESTPHMHLGLVPMTEDGRLSAKSLFDRQEMRDIQTDFAAEVGSIYGLERGVEGSERTHLSELRFKAEKELEKIVERRNEMEQLDQNIEQQREILRQEEARLHEETENIVKSRRAMVLQKVRENEAYNSAMLLQQQIDQVGEKGLIGGRVRMTKEEADMIKKQAKLYVTTDYALRQAQRDIGHLISEKEQAEKDIPELKEELRNVKTRSREIHAKYNDVVDIIKSDPNLEAHFIEQYNYLQNDEKKQSTEQFEERRDTQER